MTFRFLSLRGLIRIQYFKVWQKRWQKWREIDLFKSQKNQNRSTKNINLSKASQLISYPPNLRKS